MFAKVKNFCDSIKNIAEQLADACVEEKLGMQMFSKYEVSNCGMIKVWELRKTIYSELRFQSDE